MATGSSTTATSHRPLGLAKAVGLRSTEVRHHWGSSVVVHDPMTDQYHRLRGDEAMLLFELTPDDSLHCLVDRYQHHYPDRRMTVGRIHSLLMRWAEMGLVRGSGSGQGGQMLRRAEGLRRRRWLQHAGSWLFWRFPGIDPSPLMRVWMPCVKPMLSPLGFAAAAVFGLVSAIAFAVHHTNFVAQWPSLSEYLTWQHAAILAVVIGTTKVAHEWGHATISERLGARCRAIGPMWLVLTPALYCDVSPSWMLASRWRRVAIGCAGMAAEGLLASIAVWVWLGTPPGTVHAIAAHVIAVCGVSTLLFNANPLLRYDGYYILSDLLDVPNLGQRAKRRLAGTARRLVLGIIDPPVGDEPADRSGWMLLYGLAALAMRWLVIVTVLWALVLVLRPVMLERVGIVLAVGGAVAMTAAGLWPVVQWWRRPSNRRRIRWSRVAWCGVVAVGVLAGFAWPLPASVIGEARWVPRHQHHVFVTTPGTLTKLLVQPGQVVREGEVIARLENGETGEAVLRASGSVAAQRARIDSLRLARSSLDEASDLLPDAEALLLRLQSDLAAAERQRKALTLVAPATGIVLPAAGAVSADGRSQTSSDAAAALSPSADRDPTNSTGSTRLVSWTGRPTDPENHGCYLTPGTELLSVAATELWNVEVVVPAHQASRLQLGSRATVIDASAPDETYSGRVVDISRQRFDANRDGLAHDARRPEASANGRSGRSIVAIALDRAVSSNPRAGGSGLAKIETAPRALAAILADRLARLFRFR